MTKMPKNTPTTPQSVSPQWLTQVLRDHNVIATATVEAIQINSMSAQAGATGEIARITLEYRQPEAGAPTSLIGKFMIAGPEQPGLMDIYEREVRFYEQIALPELPVPRCYYCHIDLDSGGGVLLLEDLSNLYTADIVAGASLIEAEHVIHGMALLHAKWWNSPELTTMSWLPSFKRNLGLLRNIYNWAAFLQQVESVLPNFQLSDSFLMLGRNLDQYIDPLCDQLIKPPLTCIHCDPHLDNLLFGSTATQPPFIMLDWQLATQGRGIIDVAYFLIRSVPATQGRQVEQSLVQTYHNLLCENGVRDYDFASCWAEYQRAFFWPFLLVVGAVGLGDKTFIQKPARFQVTLERLEAFIEHHQVTELLSETITNMTTQPDVPTSLRGSFND